MLTIYDALPAGEPLRDGWWPARQWDDVLACVVPQGSAVLDPLCAIDASTRVLFLGLAGSVRGFAVGEVVEATSSWLDLHSTCPTWPSTRYPHARAVTVRCISESYQRRDELRARADVVDMESGWVLAAGQRHSRPTRVVLTISDELFGRSYLDSELTAIAPSISNAAADAAHDATRSTT